ncbi:helix-turn-helix domain-containing protein [Nocardia sp. SYP-A9097]|uniref:helix-turn-helix transcriptional regulator n=1 Tax=Nocardia sp. SYP-A9097 TaxID=2663237 RepID=UPI00129C078C|nr:helix-turn-helix transcriptional regulator [Nocardia sp. SYP-A9097]MRH90931.1 helix-turn-helix domain-containing protein [Nocardia sp. SYP-A9097]
MVSGNGNPGPSRHAQLGEFLRAQRAKLQPRDVGLRPYGDPARRRTPGLRREEVAELSGVGLTWYTWLEQGRDVAASTQVIDALARTLRLDPDQHSHLRFLAGLAEPYDRNADSDRKRLQRLVDASMPNPAVIYDPDFNYLVWNTAYVCVRHDPLELPPRQRNLMWMMFTDPANRERMPRWEFAAMAVLSQLREAMGRRPGDPALAALVADLSAASPEFRDWWTEYSIHRFRPSTVVVEHAGVGVIELELFQLRPVENPGLLMVVQVPTGEIAAGRIATLLARVGESPNVTNSDSV